MVVLLSMNCWAIACAVNRSTSAAQICIAASSNAAKSKVLFIIVKEICEVKQNDRFGWKYNTFCCKYSKNCVDCQAETKFLGKNEKNNREQNQHLVNFAHDVKRCSL